MFEINAKYKTRSGRVATVIKDTSENQIAQMAGFSFLILIEDKINEQFFVTDEGKKFQNQDSDDDLIEKIDESDIDGDPSDPFFSMSNQLSKISTSWNLYGSMQFNRK